MRIVARNDLSKDTFYYKSYLLEVTPQRWLANFDFDANTELAGCICEEEGWDCECSSEIVSSNIITHLEIPMPYTYFKVVVQNHWQQKSKVALISSIVMMHKPMKSLNDVTYEIPLPNTGIDGYTCAPSNIMGHKEISDEELVYQIPALFWEGIFLYYEACGNSHDRLHGWEVSRRNNDLIDRKAYEKWEALDIKDLSKQSWAKVATNKIHGKDFFAKAVPNFDAPHI